MPDASRGLDGYVRVSRVRGRGGDSFISPEVQRGEIARWAEFQRTEILEVFEDLDWSGGTIDRPGFQAALGRIETGDSAGIVVAKLDRFARSLPAAYEAISRIEAAGGRFVSVADQFDLSTSQGRLMFNILGSFAQFERDRITEQWQVARRHAVERGVHISSRTPTGYVRGADGRLEPHPHDGAVIRAVFAGRAGGASWRELGRLLDAQGVVGPYRAAQWTPRAVEHIIRNRVYLGEARHGEFVNPAAHDALVDRGLWDQAQRARSGPVARSSEPALLAGVLRCAGCRHLMRPDKQTMRDGSRVRIYRCRGHHASGTCTARAMVLGSVVEPWVVARMFAHLQNLLLDRIDTDRQLLELERAAEEEDAEVMAFRDDERIVGALGVDRFVDGLQARVARADEAHTLLAKARAESAPAGVGDVQELRKAWETMPVRDRQEILRAVVDAVMLRSVGQANVPIHDRALIFWTGQAPDDLPRRGRRVPLSPFTWPPSSAGVLAGEDPGERGGGG